MDCEISGHIAYYAHRETHEHVYETRHRAPGASDIDALATRMDIRIWGHAMASPGKGFLSHPARDLAKLDGKLLFAHTDAAGYSVFEEASWLGMKAAQKAIKRAWKA